MKQSIRNCFSRAQYLILTVPAVITYSMFVLFPLCIGFYYSLTDWNGSSRVINFVGFTNYRRIFRDEKVLNSFMVTLQYTAVSTIIITLIALGIALLLNQRFKLSNFYRTAFFMPATLSLIVAGMIFNNIFTKAIPLIGSWMSSDLLSYSLTSRPATAIWAVMLVYIWQGTAIPFVILLAGLQSIPMDIMESAKMDGANSLQRFWYMLLPHLLPSLEVVIVLLIRSGLTTFDYVMALTGGGPGRASETLPVLIYNQSFGGRQEFNYAVTESIILFISLASVTLFQMYLRNRKGVD